MKKVIISVLVVTIMLAVFVPAAPVAYAASNEQIIYEYLVNTMGLNTRRYKGTLPWMVTLFRKQCCEYSCCYVPNRCSFYTPRRFSLSEGKKSAPE